MSVTVLKDEFLKLEKSEQITFGKFVLEKLFNVIETESMLSSEQQQEVEKRYQDLKDGISEGVSLTDFKAQMNEKYGI